MDLKLLMCCFIRSLREGDFPLYVQVCDELCSWFHVIDHTNYARWLPVHVRDMVQLPQKHPQLYAEFLKGNFVVQRSAHKFSLISKDQRSFETVLDTTTSGTARHDEANAFIIIIILFAQ